MRRSRSASRSAVALVAAVALGGVGAAACVRPRPFRCDQSTRADPCNVAVGEVCSAAGYCAAPTSVAQCPSGLRYTATAAEPGACVPTGDGGFDDAAAGPDVADSCDPVVDDVPPSAAEQPSCAPPTPPGCGLVPVLGGTPFVLGEPGALGAPPGPRVTLGADFAVDAYEVTVARFRRYWDQGHPTPSGDIAYPSGPLTWNPVWTVAAPTDLGVDGRCNWSAAPACREAHPVNCLNWYTALAFCVWDGGRLPTEAEWEWIARFRRVDGLDAPPRRYPWGNQDPTPRCDRAQWNGCAGADGALTARVGSFRAAGGVFDMAGNVNEWMADWYQPYSDALCWGTAVQRADPLCGNERDQLRARRGGSFVSNSAPDGGVPDPAVLRSASRLGDRPSQPQHYIGMRCIRTR